jgi:hypothetical protein
MKSSCPIPLPPPIIREPRQAPAAAAAMASPPPDVDLGKLSYEIFSLLESKFLFGGGSVPGTPARAAAPGPGEDRGRVRVLAIDGRGPGPGDALLAAAALARLEAALRVAADGSRGGLIGRLFGWGSLH